MLQLKSTSSYKVAKDQYSIDVIKKSKTEFPPRGPGRTSLAWPRLELGPWTLLVKFPN
jgi:hypothetical protein